MSRIPYDHAAVARQVWEHLARYGADLTAYELGRALGWTYNTGARLSVNTGKVRTALAELAADGAVLAYQLGCPCPGGYKTVWHAIVPQEAAGGRA
jgi:hypothetical protein